MGFIIVFVSPERIPEGCEMDMLDHGYLHWVVILAHMVLVPLLAK